MSEQQSDGPVERIVGRHDVLAWLKCRSKEWGPIRTWKVGGALGLSTTKARRLLLELERDGEIVRHKVYDIPGAMAWDMPPNAALSGRWPISSQETSKHVPSVRSNA